MGAIHDKAEDERAVLMLLALPETARGWISHHFRNSLLSVLIGSEQGRKDMVKKAVQHMLEDLERIGC